jgi:hypothetical protein
LMERETPAGVWETSLPGLLSSQETSPPGMAASGRLAGPAGLPEGASVKAGVLPGQVRMGSCNPQQQAQ